ncbi:MAG: hypothetical protein ACXWZL_11845 [Mycobacterium sp.]
MVMKEPEEICDDAHEQIFERVCAIDVAKDSGKVCLRLAAESGTGRRVSRVWDVAARSRAVSDLADHLAELGVQKVTVESRRRITGGSGSTCSKPAGWTCSWSTPATSRTSRDDRRRTSWIRCG